MKFLYKKIQSKFETSLLLRNTVLNYSITLFIYLFNFISTPLLLKYLDTVNFGIYQTILMLLSWASLCDLGLGNGLRNKVSEYNAVKDYVSIKKIIGSTFFLSIFIVVILLILGGFLFFFFDPQSMFNDELANSSDVKFTFGITFVFFSLNFIISLFSSICHGLQKSYIATLVQFVNLALFCLLIYILVQASIPTKLIYVAFAYGIAMIIANLLPFFYIRRNKTIWPPIFSYHSNKSYTKSLKNVSLGFFMLKISTIILFSSDNFIIAKLMGSEYVTTYSIANKLFFFVIGVFSIILIQVWNAVAGAKANNDYLWIEKITKKLFYFILPVTAVCLFIVFFYDFITSLWLGRTFEVDKIFLFLFLLYTIFHCLNAIYVNVLNGLSQIKWQFIAYSFAALLNILLSYLFVRILDLNITGMILSKFICIVFTSTVCFMNYKQYLRKMKNEK